MTCCGKRVLVMDMNNGMGVSTVCSSGHADMHSSRLIESAHVGRCIRHTVPDHKSVHISTLLLLHLGMGRQSSGIEGIEVSIR